MGFQERLKVFLLKKLEEERNWVRIKDTPAQQELERGTCRNAMCLSRKGVDVNYIELRHLNKAERSQVLLTNFQWKTPLSGLA